MISGREIREVLREDAARVRAPRGLWEKIAERLEDEAREKGPASRDTGPPGEGEHALLRLRRHRHR